MHLDRDQTTSYSYCILCLSADACQLQAACNQQFLLFQNNDKSTLQRHGGCPWNICNPLKLHTVHSKATVSVLKSNLCSLAFQRKNTRTADSVATSADKSREDDTDVKVGWSSKYVRSSSSSSSCHFQPPKARVIPSAWSCVETHCSVNATGRNNKSYHEAFQQELGGGSGGASAAILS